MPTVRSSLILGAALLAAANLPLQAQAASRCTSTATSISCSAQTAWIDSGSAGQRKVVFQVPTGSAPSTGWPVALLFHGSLVRVSGFTYARRPSAATTRASWYAPCSTAAMRYSPPTR